MSDFDELDENLESILEQASPEGREKLERMVTDFKKRHIESGSQLRAGLEEIRLRFEDRPTVPPAAPPPSYRDDFIDAMTEQSALIRRIVQG